MAIVSAPFLLEACSYHMEKGFSLLYQRYLLKANPMRKLKAWLGTLPIDVLQLQKVRWLREFNDLITARIHGFSDAIDYYRRCSALPLLGQIANADYPREGQSLYRQPEDPRCGRATAARGVSVNRTWWSCRFCRRHFTPPENVAGNPYTRLADALSGASEMIIPWQDLASMTLDSLIESFVLRECIDYGEHESSLEQKVADVKNQLQCGDAVLVCSELHETVNIMPRAQFSS